MQIEQTENTKVIGVAHLPLIWVLWREMKI